MSITSKYGCGSRPVNRVYVAANRSATSVPCVSTRLLRKWATSSQGGPHDVSTQSTTPVISGPVHSTLRGAKSRWRNVPSYAGASSSQISNARSQAAGSRAHSGTTRLAGIAHDW